ncbi:HD domain-containing protein [Anaerosacchariphilus polymeriproducens]|uniref:HD domain-containing protein n=1 Tax=Anaerosacchariphilus polymeriproducens TaxID=1812858 RepID=A0A371ATQ4_9FIRM|nr:HD domain-containing protein [Anaerosacchariphilus polymeriproducens]RDU22945.1 HD domain-containing protein [Anaerosacchariphilus polymeriproducens]
MIYTELTMKAMKIAYSAHKDQKDKAGVPYIFHPIHLAEQMNDEETTVIALLHDVIEDTTITQDDLLKEGIPLFLVDAIVLLTKDKKEDYFEYIQRVKSNELAKIVKIEDLKHNLDETRLLTCTIKDKERRNKYKKSLKMLTT